MIFKKLSDLIYADCMINRWKRFLLISFLSLLVCPAFACKKDPDPLPQKITLYMLLCPTGLNACYGNCGSANDRSGNGIIDASELPEFNRCTSLCDTNCSTSFIFLLF